MTIKKSLLLATGFLFIPLFSLHADNTANLNPLAQTVEHNEAVNIDLEVDYVEDLFSSNFKVVYDYTILDFVSFTAASSVLNDLPTCTVAIMPFEVSDGIYEISFFRSGLGCFGTSTGGVLGTLNFTSKTKNGTTSIEFIDTVFTTYDGTTLGEVIGTWGTSTVSVYELDTTPPSISLLGDNPQEISQGSSYLELGASSTDDVYGDRLHPPTPWLDCRQHHF